MSKHNAKHFIFTLVCKINLGLAQLALKMNVFSACVNDMSQLNLVLKITLSYPSNMIYCMLSIFKVSIVGILAILFSFDQSS